MTFILMQMCFLSIENYLLFRRKKHLPILREKEMDILIDWLILEFNSKNLKDKLLKLYQYILSHIIFLKNIFKVATILFYWGKAKISNDIFKYIFFPFWRQQPSYHCELRSFPFKFFSIFTIWRDIDTKILVNN